MGGTGSVTFSMHHPEIFAYIATSSQGINNWMEVNIYGGSTDWPLDRAKWGERNVNHKCHDLIDHSSLIADRDVGMGVYDWQSCQTILPVQNAKDDLTFFHMCHGTKDNTIDWRTQGVPIWSDNAGNPFAKNFIPYSGAWWPAGHSSQGGKGANACGQVPKTHFVLALKNSTSDDALASACLTSTCDDQGQFNARILWSTKKAPIDSEPIDSPGLFETTIKLDKDSHWGMPDYTGPDPAAVDITPRRLQQFNHSPNTSYHWENIPSGGSSPIQSGDIVADRNGIFTVEGFQFSSTGNKLRITVTGTTGIGDVRDKGINGSMIQVVPNPFGTSVDIRLNSSTVPQFHRSTANPEIKIFDINGRLVSNLANCGTVELRNYGTSYRWHAQDHPGGIYVVKVTLDGKTLSRRICCVK
jgi:hypothetical protein